MSLVAKKVIYKIVSIVSWEKAKKESLYIINKYVSCNLVFSDQWWIYYGLNIGKENTDILYCRMSTLLSRILCQFFTSRLVFKLIFCKLK